MILKVLWLSPTFNHYKARFLNHLANDSNLELHIYSGTGRSKMGDKQLEGEWNFKHLAINVPKKDFGNSKLVKEVLKNSFDKFNWIMLPVEKKNLPLFLYALKLRKAHKNTKLFSYNHPILKSKNGRVTLLDKWITKFYYKKLDRVIFYTKQSYDWALEQKLIDFKKAFWANNTIDNSEIEKHYSYQLPPENSVAIVFIGRLIASKRIPELIKYYKELKERIPNLSLEVIGDGPESHYIKNAADQDINIKWHGTLIEESQIAPIMKRCSLVFVPGHSGLSINHAFAYGRPYITLIGPSHAPELDYIDKGKNGFVLEENFENNINSIAELFTNRENLEQFCNEAKLKGDYLTVHKWVKQIKLSLLHE